MNPHGQGQTPNLSVSPGFSTRRTSRTFAFLLGTAALLALAVGAWFWLQNHTRDGHAQDLEITDSKLVGQLFRNWTKPELAIVLTGQTHGYLQPCGCSRPQYGGYARRWTFLQSLKEQGWPLVAVDLGDLAQKSGPQAMLKYETAMKALKLLGYSAVGVGYNEFVMPLPDALAHYTLNNPLPRVLALNLQNRRPGDVFHDLVHSYEIAEAGNLKVGILGLVGPSVMDAVKALPNAAFAKDNAAVLRQALTELRDKQADLSVLLYQGHLKEAQAAAKYCAALHEADPKLPRLHVILCLTDDPEPPGMPERAGHSLIISMGHKGKYAGVVGAWRSPQMKDGWELKYQLVPIGPEYETAAGKEAGNPVMALMEEYAREVQRGKYLAKFPRTKHPVQAVVEGAKFVGSDMCGNCHNHAYKVWKASAHSHAFETLEKAKNPSLRHLDGECIVCHTVGFSNHTGYMDPNNNDDRNRLLKNVGCESCHGPGSAHANNPTDAKLYPLINPYKAQADEKPAFKQRRLSLMDDACQKCHDQENDVHWNFAKWTTGNIIHMTPRKDPRGKK